MTSGSSIITNLTSNLRNTYSYLASLYPEDGVTYKNITAAKSDNSAKILLTYFENDAEEQSKDVIIDLKSLAFSGNINYKCRLLDENNDCAVIKQEILSGTEELKLNVSLYSCYLLSFEESY